jgi:hypothetical protein
MEYTMPKALENLSRRSLIAGCAALAVAAPAAGSSAGLAPSVDADLIALGERFEGLLLKYFDATFEWAPLLRAAHAEVNRKYKVAEWCHLPERKRRVASKLLHSIYERSGGDAASDRTTALADDMEPLAEAIMEAEASTLGGLRAKALVVLWEARPISADHEGHLTFSDDDGGASESLFYGVAGLTGLLPMVRRIEARYAADAPTSDDDDGEAQS